MEEGLDIVPTPSFAHRAALRKAWWCCMTMLLFLTLYVFLVSGCCIFARSTDGLTGLVTGNWHPRCQIGQPGLHGCSALTFLFLLSSLLSPLSQFGICGPPQKRKVMDEMSDAPGFGGYSCAATGQASSTSFVWLRSLMITFAFQQVVFGPFWIALMSVLAPRFALFFIGNHHVKCSTAHVVEDLRHERMVQERE